MIPSIENSNKNEPKIPRESLTVDETINSLRVPTAQVIRPMVSSFPGKVAEDLIQSTFLKIVSHRAELEDGTIVDPIGWAKTIAKNVVRDFFKIVGSKEYIDRDPRRVEHVGEKSDDYINGGFGLSYDHLGSISLTSNIEKDSYEKEFLLEEGMKKLIEEFSQTLDDTDKKIFLSSCDGESLEDLRKKFPKLKPENIRLKLFRIRQKLIKFARKNNYIVDERVIEDVMKDIKHSKSPAHRRPKGSVRM